MSDDSNIDEKIFEVDGVPMKVFVGVSPDRRHVEYVIEGAEPLSAIHVAKVLEVLCSNMLKNVYVPPQIYAKEMH